MAIFSIDVQIIGTAYIKADNRAEAKVKFDRFVSKGCFEVSGDGISGLPYNDPNLPECSLSPAMTLCGIWPGVDTDFQLEG